MKLHFVRKRFVSILIIKFWTNFHPKPTHMSITPRQCITLNLGFLKALSGHNYKILIWPILVDFIRKFRPKRFRKIDSKMSMVTIGSDVGSLAVVRLRIMSRSKWLTLFHFDCLTIMSHSLTNESTSDQTRFK
jgi:hypothetical protein